MNLDPVKLAVVLAHHSRRGNKGDVSVNTSSSMTIYRVRIAQNRVLTVLSNLVPLKPPVTQSQQREVKFVHHAQVKTEQ